MITLEELFQKDKEAKEREKEKNKQRRRASKIVVKATEEPAKEYAPNAEDISIDEKEDKLQDKLDRTFEENAEEVQRSMLDNWKPYRIKDYVLPEFKIPVKKSNNYEFAKRETLSKILTFIDFAQRKRYKEGCTAMPIPSTSRQNLLIWGYSKSVSRAISFMKEIGLISLYDDSYRFGTANKEANYGKLYAYYKDNEDKLIQYCKDNGIHKYVVKNVEKVLTESQVEMIEAVEEAKTFDLSKVRFAKNLDLEKPDGVSRTDFEAFLTQCLYINYPELEFYQAKADEINERFYENYPEFKIRFKPHFTWKDKKVSKIGIRATNEFCSKPKTERAELLKKYGFYLEKDVKSSVPRLTLSINEGHWIDENIDIYELINNEFDPGTKLTKEEWELRREAIKHYMLTTYFEQGSDRLLGKNVTYKLDKEGMVKTEVDELMGRLRSAASKVLGGKTFGSDIFYVESCVYLMTVYDLLTSRHMVWLVYDAFYSNGSEDQETFEFMLRNGIKLNFEHFMEISNFRKYSKEPGDYELGDNKK